MMFCFHSLISARMLWQFPIKIEKFIGKTDKSKNNNAVSECTYYRPCNEIAHVLHKMKKVVTPYKDSGKRTF